MSKYVIFFLWLHSNTQQCQEKHMVYAFKNAAGQC